MFVLARNRMQGHQGLVADAARRDVDDAVQAGFIGRVVDEAQEGDHILDLAASVEPLRADQAIGQARLQEGFFQQTGLALVRYITAQSPGSNWRLATSCAMLSTTKEASA